MNENTIPLNRLYEGEWARVEALDSGCVMRRRLQAVSYTHLDVYKRQESNRPRHSDFKKCRAAGASADDSGGQGSR